MPEPTTISLPAPPRHDWRGLTFIGAVYLGSLGLGVLAVYLFAGVSVLSGYWAVVISIPVLIAAALGWVLAWGVRHFDHWAYRVSTVLLTLVILFSAQMVYVLYDPANPGRSALAMAVFAGILAANAFWLHYLWRRRGDFAPWDAVTLSTWRRRTTLRTGRSDPAGAVPPPPENAP